MRKLLILSLAFVALSSAAFAQTVNGKVTTVAPSYTNNAISPLSLDTSGNLRVTNAPGSSVQDVDVVGTVGLTDTELRASPVDVDVIAPLPAGTNNIGDVDVLTLPSIPAGNNNIGDVDIASIAAGTNTIGDVGLAPESGVVAVQLSALTTVQVVKASPGVLYGVQVGFVNTIISIYDNASACTGTIRAMIIGNTAGGNIWVFAQPITFTNGISACASNSVNPIFQYQ